MNKKGILLKTIMTILFALLIFIPTVLFTLKYCEYSTSAQAKDNFEELVKEIKDFSAEGREGESKLFMLIMDKNTAIFKFSEPENLVTENLRLDYPSEQCKGEECIVLCRDFSVEDILTPDFFSCTKMIGIPLEDEDVAPFFLVRLDIETGPVKTAKIIKMPRRAAITLEKKEGKIYIKQ